MIREEQREQMKVHLPSISVSGNRGASANKSPPNPHPISAISTRFVSLLFVESLPVGSSPSVVCCILPPSTKAG